MFCGEPLQGGQFAVEEFGAGPVVEQAGDADLAHCRMAGCRAVFDTGIVDTTQTAGELGSDIEADAAQTEIKEIDGDLVAVIQHYKGLAPDRFAVKGSVIDGVEC